MISFNLRCANDHEFEASFASSAAYDSQRRRRLVTCPLCDSPKVQKAPMAPAVSAKREVSPEQLRQALTQLRDTVEKNADYVGKEFPEEARKIHYGEKEARNIYGEASKDDATALADEGIEVAQIPWIKRPEKQN